MVVVLYIYGIRRRNNASYLLLLKVLFLQTVLCIYYIYTACVYIIYSSIKEYKIVAPAIIDTILPGMGECGDSSN